VSDIPKAIDVVLDIETVASMPDKLYAAMTADVSAPKNWRDPDKIKAEVNRKTAELLGEAALRPLTAAVASVAVRFVSFDRAGAETFRFDWGRTLADYAEDQEKSLLIEWRDVMDRARAAATQRFRLVTYYGRRFDVPFLGARLAVHDLDGYRILCPGYSRDHVDLHDVFGGGLGKWATLLGLEKIGKGTDVAKWIEEGDWDKVKTYNAVDVDVTAELWRRASRALEW